MQDEIHTEPAPAAEETLMPTHSGNIADVPLTDAFGNAIGVSMQVSTSDVERVEGDLNGFRALAKRVQGWGTMVVDGEPYTATDEDRERRALDLFNRFPHFAAQVKRALGETVS